MPSPPPLPCPPLEPVPSAVTAIFDAHKAEPNRVAGGGAELRDAGTRAHVRTVCMTPLEQNTGCAEFLGGLAQWALRHPDITTEVVWAADGIMRTVLAAQPTPPNVVQVFAGRLDVKAVLGVLRRCQAFAVPSPSDWAEAVAIYALLSDVQVLCGEPKRRRWGVLAAAANLHCYSRRRGETLLPALNAAFSPVLLAPGVQPFEAASYAA